MLGVALDAFEIRACGRRLKREAPVDLIEIGVTVNPRFTRAQQIEVRAVEDQ